ncbi:hypothetical protein RDI58_013604 [Solanum bulbocastanum]|uniref:Uncharacterized protein n=1 Tax=Solanum bulbocastanum TaxID=147425 RepID=A0AAN8YE49_SOLBU
MCTTNSGNLVNSTQNLRRLTSNFASENELDHDGFGVVYKGVDYIEKFVVYGSDQTYSTHSKACKVAGIFPCNVHVVLTSIERDFTLSPVVLRGIIEVDVVAGLVPLFLCATVTTSTTTVDPLSQLRQLAKEFNIWLHVDAAYGGNACICPEFRQYVDGIERANSHCAPIPSNKRSEV